MRKHLLALTALCAVGLTATPPANAGTVAIAERASSWIRSAPVSEFADLDATEKNAAAVIEPAPGQTIRATVTPAGCADVACRIAVTATGTGTGDATGTVAAGAGAKVQVTQASAGDLLASRAATPVFSSRPNDQICSSGYGCGAWSLRLGSSSYRSGGWAWGKKPKVAGYYGSYTCTKSANGYSLSTEACGFRNDPSYSDLYAEHQAKLTVLVKGFPSLGTKYLHRHYAGDGRSWLVIQ